LLILLQLTLSERFLLLQLLLNQILLGSHKAILLSDRKRVFLLL